MTATVSPSQAAELVRSTDTLGVPLGPGVPGAFMHALAAREHFDQLDVFGALMPDLFEVLDATLTDLTTGAVVAPRPI